MKRGWSHRLNVVIESNLKRPFEYGTWDCCLFVAECVEAMTGENPMPEFRNKYNDKEGALRLVRAHSAKSLYGIMRSKFGNPREGGRRGDIVYTVTEDGPTLGICIGREAVFLHEGGITTVAMADFSKVFHCG